MTERTAETGTWMNRYGTLLHVTERQGKKGPYLTFQLQAKGFKQYGACFDEKLFAEIKAAVGKKVWMRGPIDRHSRIGPDGAQISQQSYRIVLFRLQEDQDMDGVHGELADAG